MSYIQTNPNPQHKLVGDCVVRALSIALEKPWTDVYIDLCTQGLLMCDMPSSNSVWKAYLQKEGFQLSAIPNTCPDCYSVQAFTEDHKKGVYILGTGTHVVTVIDGNHYDTWDSGEEIPLFFLSREKKDGVQ